MSHVGTFGNKEPVKVPVTHFMKRFTVGNEVPVTQFRIYSKLDPLWTISTKINM